MPSPPRALLPALLCAWLLAGCAAPASSNRQWVSPKDRDHPLAGRVLDTSSGELVAFEVLERAVKDAHFVLLGETHDNPDHHLLQAQLVQAIISSGRRPALAFEMLDASQQPAVDAARFAAPEDPDQLAHAVGWAQSGWPDFSLYRPIFAAGLAAGLPVVAANLPREQVKEAVRQGEGALDPAVRAYLARQGPLPEPLLVELREELRASHCGFLPEELIEPMVLAQRARDAVMALRMLEGDPGAGAVLIAGSGHVRRDRGVPSLLAEDAKGRSILTVALVEVSQAARYQSSQAPFDYLVFTPAIERPDPCEALRKHHPPAQ